MAPLYYFYKMDYIIRAASVTFSCLLVTSFNAVEAAKFQAMDGAVPRTVVSQEKTTQARSKIECAVHCRRYPHCASFAYSSPDSTCYLHPEISATSDKSLKSKTTAVFKDEGKIFSGSSSVSFFTECLHGLLKTDILHLSFHKCQFFKIII